MAKVACYSRITYFLRGTLQKESALKHTLIDFHPHMRMYYDCYAHTLAICGNLAVILEMNLKIWDVTPAEKLAREAGGSFEYFGESQDESYNAIFGKKKAVETTKRSLQI